MLLCIIEPIVLLGAAWPHDSDDKLCSGRYVPQYHGPQHDWQTLLTLPDHTFNPIDSLGGALRGGFGGRLATHSPIVDCVGLVDFPRQDDDHGHSVVQLFTKTFLDYP